MNWKEEARILKDIRGMSLNEKIQYLFSNQILSESSSSEEDGINHLNLPDGMTLDEFMRQNNQIPLDEFEREMENIFNNKHDF